LELKIQTTEHDCKCNYETSEFHFKNHKSWVENTNKEFISKIQWVDESLARYLKFE